MSDAVICFENDRMGDMVAPKAGIHQAFAAADVTISQSVRSIVSLIQRPGLIRIGFDDLLSALRSPSGRCLFGFGESDSDNRAHDALTQALKNPLMDRGRMLADASQRSRAGRRRARHDALRSRNPDAGTRPAYRRSHADSFRHCGRWPDGKSVERDVDQLARELRKRRCAACATAASLKPPKPRRQRRWRSQWRLQFRRFGKQRGRASDVRGSRLRQPVFAGANLIQAEAAGDAEFEPEPLLPQNAAHRSCEEPPAQPRVILPKEEAALRSRSRKPVEEKKLHAKQEVLQFESVTRGRFEKSEPTIVEGQDLDVPTFLRKNVRVK